MESQRQRERAKQAESQKTENPNTPNPPEVKNDPPGNDPPATQEENKETGIEKAAEGGPKKSFDEMMAEAETNLAAGKGVEVTSTYLSLDKWKVGDKKAFMFMGMTTFMPPAKPNYPPPTEKEAVLLVDSKKESFICAGSVVVSTLKRIVDFPVPISIEKLENIPGKDYDNVKITRL